MKPRPKITAQYYLDAFLKCWASCYPNQKAGIDDIYYLDMSWTGFMLKDGGTILDEPFLAGVSKALIDRHLDQKGTFASEWYTVDHLIISGENLYKDNLAYPSEVHAIVEHENLWDIETEMWKLIHWRAPLKVLIFYRKELADRIFTTDKSHMLKTLPQMLQAVQTFWPEEPGTEYLFICGYMEASHIHWQSCTFKQSETPPPFDYLV